MWRLKGCPRCGGDVHIDLGLDGWCEQCLQCGFQRELKNINEFEPYAEGKTQEPVLSSERSGKKPRLS